MVKEKHEYLVNRRHKFKQDLTVEDYHSQNFIVKPNSDIIKKSKAAEEGCEISEVNSDRWSATDDLGKSRIQYNK